ncbi:hypothetical protein [Geodermatophilus pulveris]|uniref:hypothetical protein n=1 Tax=Geodermatophilus pulveris TaxID=1564159 RepID=UPI000B77FA7A|nr:hypothetical protein [Geodermatophilus pulveris]
MRWVAVGSLAGVLFGGIVYAFTLHALETADGQLPLWRALLVAITTTLGLAAAVLTLSIHIRATWCRRHPPHVAESDTDDTDEPGPSTDEPDDPRWDEAA